MDNRRKTIAGLAVIAIAAVIGLAVLVILLSRRNVLSPVPDEGAIRVIFLSPTPASVMQEPDASGAPEATATPSRQARTPTQPASGGSSDPTASPTGRANPSATKAPTPSP